MFSFNSATPNVNDIIFKMGNFTGRKWVKESLMVLSNTDALQSRMAKTRENKQNLTNQPINQTHTRWQYQVLVRVE